MNSDAFQKSEKATTILKLTAFADLSAITFADLSAITYPGL